MPKKILLADDSLTIQKVVELTFSDSDYELVSVSNGERALEKIREERPDLILADVVMPEKNGYEVCEVVKGDPATSRIPVVLLSGTFEPFDRERAERIGADAIVSKPFDSQQLLAQVDALIAKAPAKPSPPPVPSPMPQTTAAIAIPPMAAAPPPPAPAHHLDPPFDVGFSAEDFTASVRIPPARTGIDPFEEEYGRGDVDSAIEAFEKAHPRFGFGSGVESSEALASQPLERSEPLPVPLASEESSREEGWLREEPEKASSPAAPRPAEPSAFAAPVEHVTPLDFHAESADADSAATAALPRSAFQPVSADELPTAEFPRSAFDRRLPVETEDAGMDLPPAPFHAPSTRPSTMEISEQDASLLFDVAAPAAEKPELGHGTEPVAEPKAEPPLEPSPVEFPTPAEFAPPAAPRAAETEASAEVPGDIEMLAQRSSIPELTQMLSSVRSAGDMTDEQLDRLASKVVEKLSEKIVREIAWEVIPDMAEIVIRQRIKELEAGAE